MSWAAAKALWRDPSPIRSELFGAERLEHHAETLAATDTVTDRPVQVPLLSRRLRGNVRVLLAAYRASAASLQAGQPVTPAAEWLLDNFHLVELQLRQISADLPPGYYRQLPKLGSGPFAGYPRVFGIAWAYVAHTDSLSKAGKLSYDVASGGKTVRFELNDLSGVKPPAGAIGPGETYLGPVFDESGIRFFLVFHEELKIFMFILDQSPPVSEQYNVPVLSDRLSIGIRSGFAFYEDRYAKRKILVGVNQLNTSVNNYFDGPFDQLPDNFIEGDALKRAILAASPGMEGQIDRFGNSPDNETRYLIAPYLQYEDESELGVIAQCAATEKPPVYYNCFSFIGSSDEEGPPPDDSGQ